MVCDYWECELRSDCKERHGGKFPPCACCMQFDKCSVCSRYIECCDLVRRYLPDMFRRLVKEIRNGEDSAKTLQKINRRLKKK